MTKRREERVLGFLLTETVVRLQIVFSHLYPFLVFHTPAQLDFLLLGKATLLDNFDNLPKLLAAIALLSDFHLSSAHRTKNPTTPILIQVEGVILPHFSSHVVRSSNWAYRP